MRDVESGPDSRVRIRAGETGALVDVREVARHSDLLLHLAARDVKVRYKQTVLGVLWVVLPRLWSAPRLRAFPRHLTDRRPASLSLVRSGDLLEIV